MAPALPHSVLALSLLCVPAAGGGGSESCGDVRAGRDVVAGLRNFHKRDRSMPKPGERLMADMSVFSFMMGPDGIATKIMKTIKWFLFSGNVIGTMQYLFGMEFAPSGINVTVHDARMQEQDEALSKREFIDRHGFVLLPHKTAMRADEWGAASMAPHADPDSGWKWEDRASQKYADEVEVLLRDLYPEAKEINVKEAMVLHRGPDTSNPFYGLAVHQDYGLTIDEYDWARQSDGTGFRAKFDRSDVQGMMVINLWRPVLPMKEPIRKEPLAVLDPQTVNLDDIVPKLLVGFGGTKGLMQMDLKHSAAHKWYYYPGMTVNEVLVFRQFRWFKNQTAPELHTCFHTAFDHPAAPPDAESRTSAEYRVEVFF